MATELAEYIEDPPIGLDELVARARPEPSRLTRNLVALLGGQVVTWTMTLTWTLIVPRVLGPIGFGIVTAALSASGLFAVFLGLGTRPYLVREMVLHRDEAGRLAGTGLVLRLALTPLVAVAAFTFAKLAHYRHDEAIALYLAAAMNLMILLGDPLLAVFQAVERMKYMAYSDIINKTAQGLVGIALALIGLGAIGITANMAVVGAIVFGLNLLWARRFVHIDLRTNLTLIRSMIRESFSYWAAGLFFTVYLWIDTIMLSLMTGNRVVGWYGASTTLFQTLMFIPNLMSTSWLPRLVAAFKDSRGELMRVARTPLEVVLIISAPMAAGTAMLAGTVVDGLYGSAYREAAPVLVILGLCLPPTYMSIMSSQVLIAEGRQRVCQRLMFAATIVNPLLNLALIPLARHHWHNGAIGAAAALLITEALVAGGALIAIRGVFDRATLWRCAKALIASAAMWATARLVHGLGVGELPAAAAGVGALLLCVVGLRLLTREEIRTLQRATASLRARVMRG